MEMTLNKPLANTFGWLHANGTPVSAAAGADLSWAEELPAGVTLREGSDPFPQVKTGSGPDVAALLAGKQYRVYAVAAGEKPREALRLHAGLSGGDGGGVCFRLGDGSELTVVMDYTGGGEAPAVIQTKAVLGKGAVLRLTQIQRLDGGAVLLHDGGAVCGEGSRVELIRLILGGRETYDGWSVALEGNKSGFTADVGYRAGGEDKLDMNYEAVHTGKKTTSEMNAAGVLSDRAFKLFRGTIDLRRGCAGAVGNEAEDALLMDETVRNQTVPVILCAEEDVVGNHGATIGRLDEDLIFYLESRGMAREAVYEMMAKARIDAVIRKIPDEKTVAALLPAATEEDA